MAMHIQNHRHNSTLRSLFFGLACVLLTITAGCHQPLSKQDLTFHRDRADDDQPITGCHQPLSKRDLAQVVCQESDFSSGIDYVLNYVDTEPPTEGLLAKGVVNYCQAHFWEPALTYSDCFCTIYVYDDETTAQCAFEKACEDRPSITTVGEVACGTRGDSGVIRLTFRRDQALVDIWQDLWGPDVETLAGAVDGRVSAQYLGATK